MTSPLESDVSRHYEDGGLAQRIFQALRAAGVDENRMTIDDLAPVDEFHTAGLATTRMALSMTQLAPGMHVFDAGCGLGGTARRLAQDHGCRVSGVDLTPDFVDIARMLTEKIGLSGQCDFHVASVLDTPFADDAFDAGVTFHVAMNIEDRAGFYREVARVLKPSAPFCVFDVMKGPTQGMTYPVPWAQSEATSFLKSAAETRALLDQAGFDIVDEKNLRDFTVQFFREAAAAVAPPPVGLHLIMGESTKEKFANYLAATEAHQVEPVILIARRRG